MKSHDSRRKWRVAVLGVGVMGRHHVRVLNQLSGFEVVGAFDDDRYRLEQVCGEFGVGRFRSVEEAIEVADVVYIATPTVTHFALAKKALAASRHVFVEKPIAHTFAQAQELAEIARAAHAKVGVGHTERFNPVVRWLSQRLRGEKVLSIGIERVGPLPPRIRDVGIVTDLGVHDLDLIAYLAGSPLVDVKCVTGANLGAFEDVAQIVVRTESGVVGSINSNWLTPYKSRRLFVATEKFAVTGDLMRFSVKTFAAISGAQSSYSVDEPQIIFREPLVAQAEAFLGLLEGRDDSGVVTAEQGALVLRSVEACFVDDRRGS
jgi:predicted dehydrogenase